MRTDALDVSADAVAVARRALDEDGHRDLSSEVVQAAGLTATGVFEFRGGGVAACFAYADAVAELCASAPIAWDVDEGDTVPPHARLGSVTGDLGGLLRAERTILNLLQRGCGIATLTRAFVDAVDGTKCKILHTRKTAPGLRTFDVYAVLCGGGARHRLGLDEQVMLKDNHWHALECRGLALEDVMVRARELGSTDLCVEVEAEQHVALAARAGATRILIDNQSPETIREWQAAARDVAPEIEIEASGGITLTNVRAYADAGVDYVSVGALTHSAPAADLALEIVAH